MNERLPGMRGWMLQMLGGVAAIFLLWGAGLWVQLRDGEAATLAGLVARVPGYFLLLPAALLPFIGWLLARTVAAYADTARALTEALRLNRLANPHHRADPATPAEMCELVAEVSRVSTAHDAAIAEVEARVKRARAELAAERDQLAAVLADLSEGVIVCGAAGQIILYNTRARELLEPPRTGPRHPLDHEPVGLGRPVLAVLEREPLERALDALRTRWQRGEPGPAVQLSLPLPHGRLLRLRITPVVDADARLNGFVIVLGEAAGPEPAPPGHDTTANGRPTRMPASRPEFYDFALLREPAPVSVLDDQPLGSLGYTVFDTETTGLDPSGGDEIVSISAVRIVNGRLLREEFFDQRVDPGQPVPAAASAVHGLTDEMLRGQPRIEEVLPGFHAFARGTVLVAHNSAFDLRFLRLKEPSTGIRFEQPVLDTMLLDAVLHPQSTHALEAIARRLGTPVAARHSSLGDAMITAEVLLRMIPLLGEQGIVTLAQAQEASRRSLLVRLRY
jgi:DNA polymerase III subunit epsilon